MAGEYKISSTKYKVGGAARGLMRCPDATLLSIVEYEAVGLSSIFSSSLLSLFFLSPPPPSFHLSL